MASITLDRAWVHNGADPSDNRRFWSAQPPPSDDDAVAGDIRAAADGTLRLVTTGERRRTIPVGLVDVSDQELAWLRALAGQLVLYRDSWGRKLWGAYLSVGVTRLPDVNWRVTLNLLEVTHSESI